MRVVIVTAPVNVTVPVVLVRVTVVAASVDWNVVEPEFVIVKTPMSVPTAPETVTVEAEDIVRSLAVEPAVPDTVLSDTVPAPELVSEKLALSAKVRAASVIVPDPVAIEEVPLEVVVPSVIALLVELRAPLTAFDPAV